MHYGLLVKVTHTGQAGISIFLSDIDDAISDLDSFRKPGPIYVPVNQSVCIVYTKNVAISYETGAIRKFVGTGDLTAEFCLGIDFKAAVFPEIQDEGITVDPASEIINFTGAGVTATQTAPGQVQVNIPGAGAGDHALLANLAWLVSGHTGNPNTIAGFDGLGATRFYVIGTDIQAWDADLDAISALAGTGVVVRTGAGVYSLRTIQGTAGRVTVNNGDGVAGDPTIDVGPNVILTTTALGGDLSGFLPNPDAVDLTIAGEVQGSILYFNGLNWVQLAPGALGNVLTTQGAAANPIWSPNASGDVSGPGSSTDNALVRWDGATGTLIKDSTVLLSNAGVMTFTAAGSLQVNTIDEATVNNGVVIKGIRNYGKLPTNPAVGPAPSDGDIYYNTTLHLEMRYDGSRSKWLSIESETHTFGRNGITAAGQYYRTVDGRVMSAALGYYMNRNATVVALGYTRADNDAATFEIVANGANIATLASAATGGGSETLDGDLNTGQVLAVRNRAAGNHTSDVVGWIRVKWRV